MQHKVLLSQDHSWLRSGWRYHWFEILQKLVLHAQHRIQYSFSKSHVILSSYYDLIQFGLTQKLSKETLFFPYWYRSGITTLFDIIDPSGKILAAKLHERFSLHRKHFLDYLRVKTLADFSEKIIIAKKYQLNQWGFIC